MQNFHLLATGVPVGPLAYQVAMNEGLFVDLSDVCADPAHLGHAHREVQSIIVRYADIPEDVATNPEARARASDDLFAKPHPAWYVLSHLRPLVYSLMQLVGGTHIGGIGIAKLAPGAQIYPHYDTGAMTDFYERFHIVVQGPAECWFVCGEGDDEERVEQLTGEVWWFDSKKLHAVVNNSNETRISISVDIA